MTLCEAAGFCEILVNPYMTTWCFTAEDRTLNSYKNVIEMKPSVIMVLLSSSESGY
jgi:hypothetical protein